MSDSSPQLDIFFEPTEPTASTGPSQLLDRMRQRREDAVIAIGLPLSPSGKPLPNDVLRSALFAVSQKVFRRETKLASIEGVEVFISRGYRPTQAHLDVWEHCLALAAAQGTGKRIHFSAYSFLKAINRSANGGNDRKWLNDALLDLAGCLIRVTNGTHTYFGPLIEGGTKDEVTEEYFIEINPRLAVLFTGNRWTTVDAVERKALRRHPLGQWLHAFYSTHATPYRYKVETIKNLCGSDTDELWKFRQMLRRALAELSSVTGWSCEIDEIDCIVVKKWRHMPQTDAGIAGRDKSGELSTDRQ
jgi:hypothetical protein